MKKITNIYVENETIQLPAQPEDEWARYTTTGIRKITIKMETNNER